MQQMIPQSSPGSLHFSEHNLIISPNDTRKYQALALPNGLRVLLVEDQNSEKAAASLTVNVGHFHDPFERQGLAHFLEHMLFLGTQSHPEPGSFQQFINQHGGHHNAWTGSEHTSYFFDIDNQFLPAGLAHFAEFFTAPLLNEKYIERERNAIEAEFKLKLKDDGRRIYQVHKETVNQQHPFAKFSVGNSETLACDDIAQLKTELTEFHDLHYVAGGMTLALQSQLPLEQQEALVNSLFANIPEGKNRPPLDDTPMYLPEQLGVEIDILPTKRSQKLILCFALPSIDFQYRVKVVNFIAHLIGFEGQGSLLSSLKNKGWCNKLAAGGGVNGYNFKDFTINFDLTEEGIDNIDDIISLFFIYIHKVINNDTNHDLYEDKRRLLNLAFNYQEKVKPINYISHLSVNMQHYDPEFYIFGDYVMEGLDDQLFTQFLNYFKPENLRIININSDVKTDRKAKWYETPWLIKTIEDSRLTQWNHYLNHGETTENTLRVPKLNPYLSSHVVLEPRDNTAEFPEVIHHAEEFKFWHLQDSQFNVPKGHIYLAIDCPASCQNVYTIAQTRLFTELVMDRVIEQNYYAELAGMHYHLYVHQGGLTLHTSGLSTNQHLLIEALLTELFNLDIESGRFNEIKCQLVRHWLNSDKSKPVSQLFSHVTSTLQPNNPTATQMAEAIEDLTWDTFSEFYKKLFNQIHIEGFSHGNWTSAQAKSLACFVERLAYENHQPCAEVNRPLLSLGHGQHYLTEKDVNHPDNAIVVYYQSQEKSYEEKARMMLLNHIVSPEFFGSLRTEQQLGYLVGTGFVPFNQYPGLAFYIQSPDYDCGSLLKAIDVFIKQFVEGLEDIDAEIWHQNIQGLITQVLEIDSNLRVRSQRLWLAIATKDKDFNEREQLAKCLAQMTPQDFKSFAMSIFAHHSRLISVSDKSSINDSFVKATSCEQLGRELTPFGK